MKTAKIESALIWGPWQKEIRETFSTAQPILEQMSAELDPLYLRYLLREQTWIALKYPNWEQREIEKTWVDLCRAVESFLKATSEQASKELKEDLENRRAAVEATGVSVTWWPTVGDFEPSPELVSALKTYSEAFGLLSYEEALDRKSGGRPTSFWLDAVAFAMKEHFPEKTGLPKWPMVSCLLKCAPSIEGISMEPARIRQRLVRLKREEKAKQRFKPTVRQLAYEFRRLFVQWVKAGAKGPCPSLIQPSNFRKPAFDTSLSEQALTEITEKLYKKYAPPGE